MAAHLEFSEESDGRHPRPSPGKVLRVTAALCDILLLETDPSPYHRGRRNPPPDAARCCRKEFKLDALANHAMDAGFKESEVYWAIHQLVERGRLFLRTDPANQLTSGVGQPPGGWRPHRSAAKKPFSALLVKPTPQLWDESPFRGVIPGPAIPCEAALRGCVFHRAILFALMQLWDLHAVVTGAELPEPDDEHLRIGPRREGDRTAEGFRACYLFGWLADSIPPHDTLRQILGEAPRHLEFVNRVHAFYALLLSTLRRETELMAASAEPELTIGGQSLPAHFGRADFFARTAKSGLEFALIGEWLPIRKRRWHRRWHDGILPALGSVMCEAWAGVDFEGLSRELVAERDELQRQDEPRSLRELATKAEARRQQLTEQLPPLGGPEPQWVSDPDDAIGEPHCRVLPRIDDLLGWAATLNPQTPLTHPAPDSPEPLRTLLALNHLINEWASGRPDCQPKRRSKGAKKGAKALESGVEAKLISALSKHHKYAEESCLNPEPIGCLKLAELADVADGSASAFFKKQFKGHKAYQIMCRDTARLIRTLKHLNREIPAHQYAFQDHFEEGD